MKLPIAFRVQIKTEDFGKSANYLCPNGCPLYHAIYRHFNFLPDPIGVHITHNTAYVTYNKVRYEYVWDTKLWGKTFHKSIDADIHAAKNGKQIPNFSLDLVQEEHVDELGLHPEFLTSEIINEKQAMAKTMKTIAVIYANSSLTANEIRESKKYSFNTKDDVKVGDLIKSRSYTTPMLIVRVSDEAYKFYNSVNGDLSNTWNSTAQEDIKELVIREEASEVVYGTII